MQFSPPPNPAVMLAAAAVQNIHVMKKTIECAATLVNMLPVDAECKKSSMNRIEKKIVQEHVKRMKCTRSRTPVLG